jgi:hypothetical protein
MEKRNRTSAKDIGYALYSYFLGLSYRNTSKALSRFIRRSHVFIWKWIQHYKPERISFKRSKISKFIIDETYKLKLDKITFGFELLLN